MPCSIGSRILVADDEPDIRTILCRLLLSDGFCVCEVGDGSEVLVAADRWAPNLMIIDILMPEMSGTEAIQHLRADSRYATTPIILITGSPIVRPLERPYQLGDMMLLTKPLNLDQLLMTIKQMVQAPS
jgi:CheY-like chemotaxis protein